MKKELGKIDGASFGLREDCIGLNVTIRGNGWIVAGVGKVTLDKNMIEQLEDDGESRKDQCFAVINFVSDLLFEAQVKTVEELKGVPIEAIFEGNTLKTWRILTEVI